jgi:hypothetical protein
VHLTRQKCNPGVDNPITSGRVSACSDKLQSIAASDALDRNSQRYGEDLTRTEIVDFYQNVV